MTLLSMLSIRTAFSTPMPIRMRNPTLGGRGHIVALPEPNIRGYLRVSGRFGSPPEVIPPNEPF